ncbi:HEAT repeat domain-containing protein [Halosimplex pelagicum]|uniref:HEAT repeat domain-containing protein n=1 Tax=Halosimplex pelagicum TaxID=869886 RepID=A0A7D5T7G4_9EURY|nr:HEAT repeat domain-containing protein [Halosimplex pelagicum]QLH84711.1 HEAT repeat domain-containing protein [Halosimplex pelagicum]
MTDEESAPLEGVDTGSEALDDEDRDQIREALTSETNIRRNEAAQALSQLAERDPSTVRPFVDDLLPLLGDDRNVIAQQAGTALLGVVREHPEDLAGSVPAVFDLIERDLNSLELLGTQIVVQVVLEHPEEVAPHLDRIVAVLDGRSPAYEATDGIDMVDDEEARETMLEHDKQEHQLLIQSQGRLANVITAAAEGDPDAAADHVDALVGLFDTPDVTVVGAAVDAVSEIAQADPDAAAGAFDALVACLNHTNDTVRARAVRALGYLGDDRAVEPLEHRASVETDEDLADLAAETAAFLDES